MEPLLTVVSVFWWMMVLGFLVFVVIPVGMDIASAFKTVVKAIKERFYESHTNR